jgi:DNA-binding response OmpR family regulator
MAQILVVEDDRTVRQLLRDVLEQAGYEVIEAHNGAEGVQRYQAERPDLVITDMRLPVMEGRQLILELRRSDPASRILAISGESRLLDQARALAVADTLQKPFPFEDLLATVQQLVLLHEAGGLQCASSP